MSRQVRLVAKYAADAGCSSVGCHVAVVIASHLPNARPSVPLLAQLTGKSERTIWRALVEIEEAGVVKVDRSPGEPNRYVFPMVSPLSTTPDTHVRGQLSTPLTKRGRTPDMGVIRPLTPMSPEERREEEKERRLTFLPGSGWLTA